jgi:hypothetical protein
MAEIQPTTRLQRLMHRIDRVLAVLHAPSAAHARLMEAASAKERGVYAAAALPKLGRPPP